VRCRTQSGRSPISSFDRTTHVVRMDPRKLREMLDSLAAPVRREEGQDMIEYALLAALISIVAVAVVILIGPYIGDVFQDVVNGLQEA
jgi:Flp pilus assembly pilin Flp